MFGVKPRSLRADKGEERFWATRGKRGSSSLVIKPNGLFQPIKWKKSSYLKPNGLFMMGKRSSFKPNSLFSMTSGKRSFMKPNGLFSTFEPGKRSFSLKPNGLFSMTKRSYVDEPESLAGSHPLVDVSDTMLEPMNYYNQHWGSPAGFFGAYKRSLKPNGLFSIGKRATLDYDDEYDDEYEDDIEPEIIELAPVKREAPTFWATRGKRGNMFWATRGKRAGNFWAVRG